MSTHNMFRCNRNKTFSGQNSGVATLLLMPKRFKPRIREDLKFLRPSQLRAIWVEFSPINSNQSKRQVKVRSYNPHKQFKQLFLEDALKGIDYLASEARDLTNFGGLNINYLNKLEANFFSDLI